MLKPNIDNRRFRFNQKHNRSGVLEPNSYNDIEERLSGRTDMEYSKSLESMSSFIYYASLVTNDLFHVESGS